ncbi:MAG TPA: DUF2914 domain-containing protein [Longimicrobiales bacterium]|nr:DUF2914 domain-containing protein [Longimicrobiales bacterium]
MLSSRRIGSGRWPAATALPLALVAALVAPVQAQVRGKVTARGGGTIPPGPITVEVIGNETVQATVADAAGRFVFHDVPWSDTVRLRAYVRGFVSGQVTTVQPDTAVVLRLRPTADSTFGFAPGMPPPRGIFVGAASLVDSVVAREPKASVLCGGPQCRVASGRAPRRLHLWSRISGARRATRVEHVWYLEDREVARVPLRVWGPTWRVWSNIGLPEGWRGEGRVEIVLPTGALLAQRFFRVGEWPGAEARVAPGGRPAGIDSLQGQPLDYFQRVVAHVLRAAPGDYGPWRRAPLEVREAHLLAWRTRYVHGRSDEALFWLKLARPDSTPVWALLLMYRGMERMATFQPFFAGDLGFQPLRPFLSPPRNEQVYAFWNYVAPKERGSLAIVAGEIFADRWRRLVGEAPVRWSRRERLRSE